MIIIPDILFISILYVTVFGVFVLLYKLCKSTFGGNETIFPFRLLCDEKRNVVPIVALTAFFRTDADLERYKKYISDGIKVIGYTSYKTFPKEITDESADKYANNFNFSYTTEIKNWVSCFKNPLEYGFTNSNNLLEMSESDFKDPEYFSVKKKYDFIYSCLKDDESCPLNGWNAINRNFDLAKKCFPIMINEFNLKILVVGRLNCGLEEQYGENMEVVDFLPYHEFQTKLKESRYLFIPNIYDASPRVVTEAISKDIPVLMNKTIICGSKYINYDTGELFTDENDIRYHLTKLLDKKISPREWWVKNYSKSNSGKKFRDYLHTAFPDVTELNNIKEVQFY